MLCRIVDLGTMPGVHHGGTSYLSWHSSSMTEVSFLAFMEMSDDGFDGVHCIHTALLSSVRMLVIEESLPSS